MKRYVKLALDRGSPPEDRGGMGGRTRRLPILPAGYAPTVISIVAESPGITLDAISARTSLFRSVVADTLRSLLDHRMVEHKGDRFYHRPRRKRPQSWRERLAYWLLRAA
jgi:hypothetical protein